MNQNRGRSGRGGRGGGRGGSRGGGTVGGDRLAPPTLSNGQKGADSFTVVKNIFPSFPSHTPYDTTLLIHRFSNKAT